MMNFTEFKKAGSDLFDAATTSFQRGVKIAEVTSTRDNDSQPVYALNDLVQACNQQPGEAKFIAEALLRKVRSTNPVVKYKALKAIRYLCQNCTNSQFKKCCGGVNAAAIRESQTWSGTPHPQLGNALNMRVRDTARETLEEVFRVVQPTPQAPPTLSPENSSSGASNLRGRIQGYGSTTGAKIQTSGGGWGRRGSATGTVGGDGSSNGIGSSMTFSSNYNGGVKKYGGFGSDDVRAAEATGGSWLEAADKRNSSAGASGHEALAPSPADARATIGDEESVVASFCAATGGVRPQPTPEQLRRFVQKCCQLEPDVIAIELSQKLVASSWQERVRALAAIHTIADVVSRAAGEHVLALTVATLASVPDAFDSVLSHSNAAVRQSAARCMTALGIERSGASNGAASVTSAAGGVRTSGLGDLLGGMGVDDVPEQSTTAESSYVAQDDPLGDLLGGAPEPAAAIAAPVPPPDEQVDLLGGLDDLMPPAAATSTQQRPAPAPTAPDDMFAGLTFSDAPVTTAAVVDDDPLAGLESLGAVPPPPAAHAASRPCGQSVQPALDAARDFSLPAVGVRTSSQYEAFPGGFPAGVSPHAATQGSYHAGSSPQAAIAGSFQTSPQPGVMHAPQQAQGTFGAWPQVAGMKANGQQPVYGQQMHGASQAVYPGSPGMNGSAGRSISGRLASSASMGRSTGRPKDAFDFVNDL